MRSLSCRGLAPHGSHPRPPARLPKCRARVCVGGGGVQWLGARAGCAPCLMACAPCLMACRAAAQERHPQQLRLHLRRQPLLLRGAVQALPQQRDDLAALLRAGGVLPVRQVRRRGAACFTAIAATRVAHGAQRAPALWLHCHVSDTSKYFNQSWCTACQAEGGARQQQPACARLTLRRGAGSYQGQALWNRADLSFGYLTANGGYRGHQFPVVIGETGSTLTQARPPAACSSPLRPVAQAALVCAAGAQPLYGRCSAPPTPTELLVWQWACSGRTPGARLLCMRRCAGIMAAKRSLTARARIWRTTQGVDQAFFRDFASYLKNEGGANNGKHSAIPHVFWCARSCRRWGRVGYPTLPCQRNAPPLLCGACGREGERPARGRAGGPGTATRSPWAASPTRTGTRCARRAAPSSAVKSRPLDIVKCMECITPGACPCASL